MLDKARTLGGPKAMKTKINYVVHTVVKDVTCVPMGRVGRIGWFVNFENSHESLFFGYDRPDFAIGEPIKITFERLAA